MKLKKLFKLNEIKEPWIKNKIINGFELNWMNDFAKKTN